MPTPLILVPGLLCDAGLWTDQRYAIGAERAVRVADISLSSSIEGMAAQILQGAPERFALAGLSMGGYVAQAIAALAPDRIAGLALLDTNAHADAPEATAKRRAQIARSETDFDGVLDDMFPGLVAPAHAGDARLATAWKAQAHRLGRDSFVRQQTAIIGRVDRMEMLRGLRLPALVLCGAEDQLTPPDKHRAMADALPDAELVIVDGAGHLSPMEKPAEVTAALARWLARLD